MKNISLCSAPPLIFFALLLIWMAASIFLIESPIDALKTFITLTITFISSLYFFSCLLRASPLLISKIYTIVKMAGIIFILLIITQIYIDSFIIDSGRSAYMLKIKPVGSILGLTSFVGCAFLWTYGNKSLSLLIFFILLCLIALSFCQTAFYAFITGMMMFGFSIFAPFWTTRIAMIFSYSFLLLAPLFYTYVLNPSMIIQSPYLQTFVNKSLFHRWLAWEYYSKKFFEKPLLGWGFESSRFIPTKPELVSGYKSLLHPHNNSIQAYVELGLIGGVLYALFFSSLFYLVEKHVKDRLSIAVCNATLTFGFISAEITHNAWRNYWLSLAALTAGLIILFIKAREAQLPASTDHLAQPLDL